MAHAADPDRCLACGGALERGVLVDRGHYGVETPLRWTPGPLGHGARDAEDVPRHDWREPVAVHAARCTVCGRLELFAHDPSVRFAKPDPSLRFPPS